MNHENTAMSNSSSSMNLTGLAGLNLGNAVAAPEQPAAPVEAPRPVRTAKPADKNGWWWGTGRRKSAVARLRIKPSDAGKGTFTIVQDRKKGKKTIKHVRTIEEYFTEERDRTDCLSPLKIANAIGNFDVVVRAHGGGTMGQAGAIRLALSRALRDYDPALDAQFRAEGFLTRDARKVERKKYGQAGARRRFQFSKR